MFYEVKKILSLLLSVAFSSIGFIAAITVAALSVREESTAVELSNYTNQKIFNVLDPVFLLNKQQWEMMSKPINIKEPYMLVYSLGAGKYFRKAVDINKHNTKPPN